MTDFFGGLPVDLASYVGIIQCRTKIVPRDKNKALH